MGKSLEQVLSNILVSNPDAVVVLNQLARESVTRNFVAIDNREASCTEQDIFYINTYEIAKLENRLDIDSLYKIDIDFTDGRKLVLEYYEPVKMQSDYEKLLYWFQRRNQEDEYDGDTDIEDSDSDSDDSGSEYDSDGGDGGSGTNPGGEDINYEEETNPNDGPEVVSDEVEFNYYVTSFAKNGMTPSAVNLYVMCDYYLHILSEEPHFEQGEIIILSGTRTLDKSRMQTENGKKYVCVNIFKRQIPPQQPGVYLYEFSQNPISFHYNWEQANAETTPDGFERWSFIAHIDERVETHI